MSRSYKKTPRSGDRKDKFFKKYANRVVRRDKYNNLQYNAYRKKFCRWDICDYEDVGTTFEQFWRRCIRSWYLWGHYNEPYPTREQAYEDYCRWYKRK